MKGKSQTPQEVKLQQLKEILPEAFTEGKVDWEKLKATLGEDINFANERYVLNWAGKSDAFKILQTPTTKSLIPAKEESVNFDQTEHIFIEGENLEVLKVLQKSYFGKVKMIYIDPPYNTGNDSFIYPDKFSETRADYDKRVGDKDEDGYMTKDGMFKRNSKENGQYHSNWLNMMMPRLYLAKNLLRQDGVIFVSIDDNEVHNLRLLMNEIFGEENFIGKIIPVTNPRGSQEPFGVSSQHEYLLCYSKNENGKGNMIGTERSSDDSEFSYIDKNGKKGRLLGLRKRGGDWRRQDRPNMYYPFFINKKNLEVSLQKSEDFDIEVYPVRPDGSESRWTWGKNTSKENIHLLTGKEIIRNGEQFFDIYRIDHLEKENGRLKTEKIKSIWNYKELNYQYARQYLKDFFGSSEIFDFPKSPFFINKLASILKGKNGIILDFFSGSGTTAHAIMQLNSEDRGNRKCISVQLPEPTDEKSEAYKAGYKTIAEIGKERIRRAGKKIKKEIEKEIEKITTQITKLQSELPTEETQSEIETLKTRIEQLETQDLGFKVLKLGDSNFKQWQQLLSHDAKALEDQMKLFVDPVSESATTENMVYELLLKSGKDLNSKIERKDGFHCINGNELVLMLEKATQKNIDDVIALKPTKVIALDKLFKGNDQLKTNTVLQMKDAEVEFKTI